MDLNKKHLGLSAESAVSSFLVSKGFKIVTQNYCIPRVGELDLVCLDVNFIVYFIEVRYRSHQDNGSVLNEEDMEGIFSAFKRSKFIKISRIFASKHNVDFNTAKKILVLVTAFASCFVISKILDIDSGEEVVMF